MTSTHPSRQHTDRPEPVIELDAVDPGDGHVHDGPAPCARCAAEATLNRPTRRWLDRLAARLGRRRAAPAADSVAGEQVWATELANPVVDDLDDVDDTWLAPEDPGDAEIDWDSEIPRRDPPSRSKWLDRWGWWENMAVGAWTTTRQAEALNLATTRRSGRHNGLMAGLNKSGRSMVIADPFELYGDAVSNINVCVIGDIGKAKSSLIKTVYLLRQLIPGRQIVIIDKKLQNGVGEYTPTAQALGVTTIRFASSDAESGACLNLLDPMIATLGEHAKGLAGVTPAGQINLVQAVLEDTMGRALESTEIAAVSRGLEVVNAEARAEHREATIRDLSRWLLDPPADPDHFGQLWAEEARRWGRDPGLALDRLASGDLKGLVDQPTSANVREALKHQMVHFDISGLPTNGPAVRVVMTVINTLLANICAARSSAFKQTILIVEEGWHTAVGSTGEVFQANMKLSRGLGLSTVSAFHHISDLPEDSPARALMREAGIVFLYGQERETDALETARMYHLPAGTKNVLMALRQGDCLVKIGSAPPIFMTHVRSPLEVELTNTDKAITGNRELHAA
ncbi:ATP/GTP-binding protein [Gordonia sp. N1V]|uniref:ATP/GTP-binding protein n=1 Tax=Gordonia sp. N1V TaxID=3034163 RepID=UPI0023E1891C|nr:ATP/GTP-binding protein [Gordonia sp. N1V]MDF3285029.1 ATP/GTP-binding protein [Gordonia sp. N1V]